MHFLDNRGKTQFEAREEEPFSGEGSTAVNRDDDIAYVIEAGRGFEALKYAASLLTGTLLLDLTGSERAVQDQTLSGKAKDALKEARDHILSAKPHSDRAAHHKHHMLLALQYLTEAVAHGNKSANLIRDLRSEAVFQAIRTAWSELNRLDNLLKGFRTIDLDQSCCAYHAKLTMRHVHFCYEAGPTGYGLHRLIQSPGVSASG
jgi:hypothetical protein